MWYCHWEIVVQPWEKHAAPLEIVLRSTDRKEKFCLINVIAVILKTEQFGNSWKSLHPEAFLSRSFCYLS